MDSSIALLDTPKRASLQFRSTTLRTALKDFERAFAVAHDGRKPSKDDIKADAGIAGRYREYNKIRDVLAGKLSLAVLEASSSLKKRKSHAKSQSSVSISPTKQKLHSTPRGKHLRPDDIDPYDAPSSSTPRAVLSAIGPTPQRDGQVLGIFDLLSNPGSGRSIQATPSSKKRKIDALLAQDDDVENRPVVAQTPSQRLSKDPGDIFDHLEGTPVSQLRASRYKHSRTPISDGKKFMLRQFFATPSAVRYAGIGGSQSNLDARQQRIDPTPLRTRVLGLSPSNPLQKDTVPDSTPAYLRRSYSFKDRLLSASAKPSSDNNSDAEPYSPPSIRVGPRAIRDRQAKFMPKPLSQIAAEMRKREDDRYDDDLDALREMENGETGGGAGYSQPTGIPSAGDAVEEQTQRVWKKKGQKRTTRRVIMRPSKIKARDEHQFVAPQDDDDNEEEGEDEQQQEGNADGHGSEHEIHPTSRPRDDIGDDDVFNEAADAREDDDVPQASKRGKMKKQKTSKQASEEKPLGKPPKPPKESTSKKKDTFNPNATAHMNFRSLKIKNKNSKAKGRGGRGRFGRR